MTFMFLAGIALVTMADSRKSIKAEIGGFLIATLIADFLLIAYGIDAWRSRP